MRPTEKSADDFEDDIEAIVPEDAVKSGSGVEHFIAHASRGALGLSTTGNRTVPPLRHREVWDALADDPPDSGLHDQRLKPESHWTGGALEESGKLRGVMLVFRWRRTSEPRGCWRRWTRGSYGDEPREAFRERYAGEALKSPWAMAADGWSSLPATIRSISRLGRLF